MVLITEEEEMDTYQDLDTAYVAQLCLSWEALHCQYTQLSHLISCQSETPTYYNHTAQEFQQFLVLLQRYIENEPYEQGSRSELYARNAMPMLLQAPKIQGSDKKEMEKDANFMVFANDLIKIIESSILTFNLFLNMDKKKQIWGYSLVWEPQQQPYELCGVSHKEKNFCRRGESKGAFEED